MPRISDEYLESVIYLYPSEKDANEGKPCGATGFLVSVPSEIRPDRVYIYGVTNSHVVKEGISTVIRVNKKNGEITTAVPEPDKWVHHPDGDDIAIISLYGKFEALKSRYIPSSMFLTQNLIDKHDIGPGSEIFMCGRFSEHDGKLQNLPSVRFGNISMMPIKAVKHPRGIELESFLIETRSIGGYSGSPIFVYLEKIGIWLLGIDWGHLDRFEKVKQKNKVTDTQEGFVVKSNTGIMTALPAWKLHELLYSEEEITKRKELDTRLNTDQ